MTADQSFLESPLKHVISPLVAPVGNMKRISDGVLICYPNGHARSGLRFDSVQEKHYVGRI